jgi:hypothetical protein
MANSEEFREEVNAALESAVAGNADLDDLEATLEDAQRRVDLIRQTWNGGGE